jgi:hypothetical protein
MIIIISFMQGIYTYIPETNYVHREYSVSAILLLLFMVLISLLSMLNLFYFYISTFRSVCAVPNMAVFCSSLTSWFPGMLLTFYYYYYYYYYMLTIASSNVLIWSEFGSTSDVCRASALTLRYQPEPTRKPRQGLAVQIKTESLPVQIYVRGTKGKV